LFPVREPDIGNWACKNLSKYLAIRLLVWISGFHKNCLKFTGNPDPFYMVMVWARKQYTDEMNLFL